MRDMDLRAELDPAWWDSPFCSEDGVVCHEDDIKIVVRDFIDFPSPLLMARHSLAQSRILLSPSLP
jgi:hypothetical protein